MLASVVCAAAQWDPRLSALDHVRSLINDFLDVSTLCPLPDAAAKGNLSLFQHVLRRVVSSSSIDPWLRYHWLGKAMENAIEGGYLDIVKLIHEAHPASLAVQSFTIAVEAGQLEILQWLHQNRFDGLCIDVPPAQKDISSMRCCLAPPFMLLSRNIGRLRVHRWLYETGYGFDIPAGAEDIAAAHGDLEMVQWLYTKKVGGVRMYTFTSRAVQAAVMHGHVKVFQFLHKRGIEGVSDEVMIQAIARGHTAIVEYITKRGIWSFTESEALVIAAAKHGRVDLLERYKHLVTEPTVRARVMKAAVCHGQVQVAQWLGNCRVDGAGLFLAASYGHFVMVQWVHEHDCGECQAWMIRRAAMGGHVEVVKWFHQHQPTFFTDSDFLQAAAESGDLRFVKWVHAHGHKVNSGAVRDAVEKGRVEMAKWLLANCEEPVSPLFHQPSDFTKAVNSGNLEMLMWLHDQGCEGLTRADTLTAPPDVQMWLHDVLGFPITEELVTHAASLGNLAYMQWLDARSDIRVDSSDQPPHRRHWMAHHRQDGDV